MYRITENRTVISVLGLVVMLAAGSAAAEYRVTAFGNTKAYGALIAMDASKAEQAFLRSNMAGLDFEEANNFCVTKILNKDFPEAIAACESALDKVKESVYVSAFTKKSVKASIYSNLAVASALAGDLSMATEYLELSMSLDSNAANTLINSNLITTLTIAQN